MSNLNINDDIKIISKSSIWKDKIGKIINIFNNGDYLVSINFNDKRHVSEIFSDKDLEKVEMENNPKEIIMNKQALLAEALEDEEFNDFEEDYVDDTLDLDSDFIKDYVDDSWFFASKIATAEGIAEDDVIAAAIKNKYKIYCLKTNDFERVVIADKSVDADAIAEQYGDYVIGKASIFEVK